MKNLSKEEMATGYTDMLTKNCELDKDQIAKIKKVNLDYISRISEDVKGNAKKYEDEYDAELKKVLNKDQYGKWETNKKKWTDTLKDTWNDVKESVKDGVKEMKK